MLALVVAGACRPTPPPAKPCRESPRVLTYDELVDYMARRNACTDEACRAPLRAEIEGAVVSTDDLRRAIDAAKVEAARDDRGKVALDELTAIRDDACRCTDAACADHSQADFEAWADRHIDTKSTQADAEQAAEIAEEISRCILDASGPD